MTNPYNSPTRAPMASAPFVYNDDQSVAWERMWDSFCVLASAGGPPHRPTCLEPDANNDPSAPDYQRAVAEIVRGICLVSGLNAVAAEPGWIAVECGNVAQALWLSEQIAQENVASFQRGTQFFVPVGATFALHAEIKNVITAVAKTTHYWVEHLAPEVKQSYLWEARFQRILQQFQLGWSQLRDRWPMIVSSEKSTR